MLVEQQRNDAIAPQAKARASRDRRRTIELHDLERRRSAPREREDAERASEETAPFESYPPEMERARLPPGMARLIKSRGGRNLTLEQYRLTVLVVTFLSYMMYHAARKPPSIVKSCLLYTSPSPRD